MGQTRFTREVHPPLHEKTFAAVPYSGKGHSSPPKYIWNWPDQRRSITSILLSLFFVERWMGCFACAVQDTTTLVPFYFSRDRKADRVAASYSFFRWNSKVSGVCLETFSPSGSRCALLCVCPLFLYPPEVVVHSVGYPSFSPKMCQVFPYVSFSPPLFRQEVECPCREAPTQPIDVPGLAVPPPFPPPPCLLLRMMYFTPLPFLSSTGTDFFFLGHLPPLCGTPVDCSLPLR